MFSFRRKPKIQISLEEWLHERGLVPCDFPFTVYETRIKKSILVENAFVEDAEILRQRAVITTPNRYLGFDFDSMRDGQVVLGKYRVQHLGSFVLLYEQHKLPYKYFLYMKP